MRTSSLIVSARHREAENRLHDETENHTVLLVQVSPRLASRVAHYLGTQVINDESTDKRPGLEEQRQCTAWTGGAEVGSQRRKS